MTRYQTVALIPAFLIIWWLKPTLQSNMKISLVITRQKLIDLAIVLASFIVVYALWIIPGLLQGVDINSLLGLDVGFVTSEPNIREPFPASSSGF